MAHSGCLVMETNGSVATRTLESKNDSRDPPRNGRTRSIALCNSSCSADFLAHSEEVSAIDPWPLPLGVSGPVEREPADRAEDTRGRPDLVEPETRDEGE